MRSHVRVRDIYSWHNKGRFVITRDEFKKLVIALGKKWLFPDFTNKLTWFVVSVGCTILLAPTPLKLLLYNWLVDTINMNSGVKFTLAEINTNSIDYIWGFSLVVLALVHNIASRYFQYISTSITYKEKEKSEIADKDLFNKFLETLPSNSPSIYLLRDQDFGSFYNNDDIDQINDFIDKWDNTEHQFLDTELEVKRKELLRGCNLFISNLVTSSGPINIGSFYSVIPDGHRGDWEQPDYVNEKIKDLNQKATNCYSQHQEFITLCKNKLKC